MQISATLGRCATLLSLHQELANMQKFQMSVLLSQLPAEHLLDSEEVYPSCVSLHH